MPQERECYQIATNIQYLPLRVLLLKSRVVHTCNPSTLKVGARRSKSFTLLSYTVNRRPPSALGGCVSKRRKDVLVLLSSIEMVIALAVNTNDWKETIELDPEPMF